MDALGCLEDIARFTALMDEADYEHDKQTRLAVERCFEILGEAFVRVRNRDPTVLDELRDWQKAIAFRNILAHGYDQISNRIFWSIIVVDLPVLKGDLRRLLGERADG